ncbi:MAG TPA: hypothetical protein VN723_11010 [Rhizomicrobium sp.]|jgi:opacity protein-like surface antigen|nr:hypothetical protein [Rhizomicrobium sp.]
MALPAVFAYWLASPALAYRPFDSTDAAIADKGAWEFEFSPLSYEHGDGGAAYVAPSLRMNYGLAERWELVLEGQVDNFTRVGSELSEAQLDAKTILREGSLQEKEGPSVAAEFSVLLPGIGAQNGAGFEWTGIVSQRWEWGTVHLNIAGILTREQTMGMFGGLIVEGPDDWPIRPVAEVNYEQDSSFEKTYSALAGVIWKVSDHLAFDLAYRHAWIDARPDDQIRAGVTFDL